MEQQELRNYTFLVDGGLRAGARATSEKVAEARIRQTWPRSDIKCLGVDLYPPRGDIPAAPTGHARPTDLSGFEHKTVRRVAPVERDTRSAEEIATESLLDAYAKH